MRFTKRGGRWARAAQSSSTGACCSALAVHFWSLQPPWQGTGIPTLDPVRPHARFPDIRSGASRVLPPSRRHPAGIFVPQFRTDRSPSQPRKRPYPLHSARSPLRFPEQPLPLNTCITWSRRSNHVVRPSHHKRLQIRSIITVLASTNSANVAVRYGNASGAGSRLLANVGAASGPNLAIQAGR